MNKYVGYITTTYATSSVSIFNCSIQSHYYLRASPSCGQFYNRLMDFPQPKYDFYMVWCPHFQNQPVEVFFSITITAYPKIDTANQKLTTDFDLNLRWYDPRLIFRDLKADEVFNDLTPEDKKFIWSPRLELPNALGSVPKEFDDESTTVMLSMENEETLPEDFSLDREGMTF